MSLIDDDESPYKAFHLDAIADADPYPYWYDDADEPDSNPTLVRMENCDLCIVGGGYNGLWTAIIAKERDPNRDVILIEAHEVGSAASGRNGGFMEASLTHGVANGQERFPSELPLLEELGLKNLNDIEDAIRRYNIDCDYERTGVIDIATTFHAPSYLDELREDYTQLRALGQKVEWLDQVAMQAKVNSPTYLGGLWRKDRAALVDPARLAWGLKRAAMSLGVRIYEDTFTVQLRDLAQNFRLFQKAEVKSVETAKRSLMPPYNLPPGELDDLVAYLSTLRGALSSQDSKQAEGIR